MDGVLVRVGSEGTSVVVEVHGWGDGVEVRPSSRGGNAEFGVFDTEVGAVDAESRFVDEADMGVYGDGRGYGDVPEPEPSLMRADFGGTSGGMLPDLSRDEEPDLFSRVVGMTSGVRVLGEMGCLGGDAVNVREMWLLTLSSCPEASRIISAFSSSAGPEMQESMLSPKGCCRQLFPGALIDRSCSAGRPGIVGESIAISCTVVIGVGPNSGTLTFLLRTSVCSFTFPLADVPIITCAFSDISS